MKKVIAIFSVIIIFLGGLCTKFVCEKNKVNKRKTEHTNYILYALFHIKLRHELLMFHTVTIFIAVLH